MCCGVEEFPSFPLWVVGLDVLSVFILSFGQTRYRVTFEVTLLMLAAVQLDWFWSKLFPATRAGMRSHPDDAVELPAEAEPVPLVV